MYSCTQYLGELTIANCCCAEGIRRSVCVRFVSYVARVRQPRSLVYYQFNLGISFQHRKRMLQAFRYEIGTRRSEREWEKTVPIKRPGKRNQISKTKILFRNHSALIPLLLCSWCCCCSILRFATFCQSERSILHSSSLSLAWRSVRRNNFIH